MVRGTDPAADEVAELVEQFWSLGAKSVDLGLARLVRSPAAPSHPLGNFLTDVRACSADQLASLLADVEAVTGEPCRRVLVPPRTPPRVEALLALDDWRLDALLQLVLPASVAVAPGSSGASACGPAPTAPP